MTQRKFKMMNETLKRNSSTVASSLKTSTLSTQWQILNYWNYEITSQETKQFSIFLEIHFKKKFYISTIKIHISKCHLFTENIISKRQCWLCFTVAFLHKCIGRWQEWLFENHNSSATLDECVWPYFSKAKWVSWY